MNSRKYKDQALIIEGSKSGAELPITKLSYDANDQVEYIGEAERSSPTNAPKWFIEKITYTSELATSINIASNKIYTGIVTLAVDVTTNAPYITITFTGLNAVFKDLINVNDQVNITTATNANLIQGIITNYDRVTDTIIVDVQGTSGIVAEAGTVTLANDCFFILNHTSTADYNNRVWDLRSNYIYE